MPLRGIIFPTELAYFGYVERVYVQLHLHKITRLQSDGLSAHEIAADMNRRRWAGYGKAWDADKVIGVVRLNELIQRSDLITRLNIMKGGQ